MIEKKEINIFYVRTKNVYFPNIALVQSSHKQQLWLCLNISLYIKLSCVFPDIITNIYQSNYFSNRQQPDVSFVVVVVVDVVVGKYD